MGTRVRNQPPRTEPAAGVRLSRPHARQLACALRWPGSAARMGALARRSTRSARGGEPGCARRPRTSRRRCGRASRPSAASAPTGVQPGRICGCWTATCCASRSDRRCRGNPTCPRPTWTRPGTRGRRRSWRSPWEYRWRRWLGGVASWPCPRMSSASCSAWWRFRLRPGPGHCPSRLWAAGRRRPWPLGLLAGAARLGSAATVGPGRCSDRGRGVAAGPLGRGAGWCGLNDAGAPASGTFNRRRGARGAAALRVA